VLKIILFHKIDLLHVVDAVLLPAAMKSPNLLYVAYPIKLSVDASVPEHSVLELFTTLLLLKAHLELVMILPIQPLQLVAILQVLIFGLYVLLDTLLALQHHSTLVVPLDLYVSQPNSIQFPFVRPLPHLALRTINVLLWEPSMDFPAAKMGYASAEVTFRDLPPLQINADVMHLLN